MGARVVKLICSYCQKPFKGEHKQVRQATVCCTYRCDRARRYKALREHVITNWRYLPYEARRRAGAWLTS